jgi:hypothetical protein
MSDDTRLDQIIEDALSYADAGMAIFPVHATTKAPMTGYGWAMLATSKRKDVIEDFVNAIMLWGHDNVSIAWALGNDGCMAVDLDHQPEPDWVRQIEPFAAINPTRRGRHLYFRNPDGVKPGNGISAFPTKGWGDVRGAGGYVVIAGPDRPGLTMEQFERIQPYPIPDHLTPYGGYTTAANKEEIVAFANQHHSSMGDQYLNWLRTAIETQWIPGHEGEPGTGRHPLACEWMAKVADEAQGGAYAFKDGYDLVHDWFKRVKPEANPREWPGIVSWAVGRALAKASSPPTSEGAGDEPETLLGDNDMALVNWHEFFTKERLDPEWLVTDLWPFGRHISIGSRAGHGKSELIQYVVSCLALGIDPWTRQAREPQRVIYLDMEMTEEDLYERMTAFGYGVQDADLLQSNLLYAQLPVMPALNSQAGLHYVERLCDRYSPSVFIIDTFMKTLAGDENDAATVQEFTRLTGMFLKNRRIMSGRADHYGKNMEQGNRGTSAKDDDVDVAWRLVRPQGSYTSKLTATKRRQGFVPERLFIERYHTAERGVFFVPQDQVIANVPDSTEHDLIQVMDLLDIPLAWGRDRIRRRLVEQGYEPGENAVLAEAIRIRKARGPQLRVVKDDDE